MSLSHHHVHERSTLLFWGTNHCVASGFNFICSLDVVYQFQIKKSPLLSIQDNHLPSFFIIKHTLLETMKH